MYFIPLRMPYAPGGTAYAQADGTGDRCSCRDGAWHGVGHGASAAADGVFVFFFIICL